MRLRPTKEGTLEKKTGRRSLKVAGLFAGVGGIERGLSVAGHEPRLFCEVDPAAITVLEKRFADVELHRDVHTLSRLPRDVDLVTAGFPCQDLSQAGTTNGIHGRKSGTVKEVIRLLELREIPWVLFENVPFMLHLRGGAAIRFLLSSLERLGYRWAYRVVDARAFGVPQRRERVYVLASLVDDPRAVLLADDAPAGGGTADAATVACGFYWTEGNRGLGWAVDCVPPLKGGSGKGIPSPPAILLPDGAIVVPDIRDAERLQGFPADWTKPADRVNPKHRWRLVGNAVNTRVASWLGRRLASPGDFDESLSTPLDRDSPWPKAAWSIGDGRWRADLGTWPVRRSGEPLAQFLHFPTRALSRAAASGFYSRLLKSRLRVQVRLVEALEQHLGTLGDNEIRADLSRTEAA